MQGWIFGVVSFALLVSSVIAVQVRAETNPVQKVIELLTQLQGQCISEGEQAKRTYDDFVNWCSRTAQEKQHEIQIASAQQDQLEAEIQQAESIVEQDNSRIGELSGSIATDEADLKAATMLREKENQDFEETDKELVDTIDTLNRAIGILERQRQQGGAGAVFLQKPTQGMLAFTQAIGGLIDAANILTVDDRAVLKKLIQDQQGGDSGDSDDESAELPSAESMLQGQASQSQPSTPAYTSNTGGIIETMESFQEKAEAAQTEGRRKEAAQKHNFDLLKLSIENKLTTENRELDETKQDLALQQEKKATGEGDLEVTRKDLASDQAYLSNLQQDCMDRAVTFQSDMTNRQQELTALAQAKKVIQQQTGGAISHTYSFLQVSATSKSQVASLTPQIRQGVLAWQGLTQLAKTTQSVALAQLSNRLASAIRTSAQAGHQSDPFEKVKSMIKTMIQKLTQEAQEEENQKAFCDREMGHTEEQRKYKEKSIEELTTKIEKSSADSARLKEEIATLSQELADLEKAQAEAARIRQEENAGFVQASGAIKMGLTGIQTAMSILRQFYGGGGAASMVQVQTGANLADSMGAAAAASVQAASQDSQPTGAAAGIIGMLEVVESDFSKNLAEVEQEEDQNAGEFDKLSQENKMTKAMKETDIKHKTSESTSLDKRASELSSDRSQIQDELDAVLEYYEKLKPQCITKPDTYEERKSRREKEVSGLEHALELLETETA